MKKLCIFITALFLANITIGANSVFADVKNSYYFTKDGSDFSAEEKDQEAQYIYNNCQEHFIQRVYFDCACIAGAFRQARDDGPIVPQDNLLNELMRNDKRGCTNTTAIAGETYEFCSEYARVFRKRNRDNAEFCKCTANKTANGFKKEPRLSMRHIEKVRLSAMTTCNKEYPKAKR